MFYIELWFVANRFNGTVNVIEEVKQRKMWRKWTRKKRMRANLIRSCVWLAEYGVVCVREREKEYFLIHFSCLFKFYITWDSKRATLRVYLVEQNQYNIIYLHISLIFIEPVVKYPHWLRLLFPQWGGNKAINPIVPERLQTENSMNKWNST